MNWVQSHFGEISAEAGHVVSAIVGFFTSLPNKVIGFFDDIRSDVAAVWNHMNADVQQLMGDVVHWFTGLPGRILTGLGNLLTLLVHAGEDLIQGLVNGIEGFAGHVVNAVKHVVSSACHEFESGFGLWSPSHVTAGYGQQIDQGLANGITDNTGLVVNAAAVMSSGLRTTLVDGVSAAYAAAAVSAQAGNVTLAGIIESGKKGSQGLATAPAALANPFADIPAALAKLAAMGNAAITKIGNATAAAPIGGGSSGGGVAAAAAEEEAAVARQARSLRLPPRRRPRRPRPRRLWLPRAGRRRSRTPARMRRVAPGRLAR